MLKAAVYHIGVNVAWWCNGLHGFFIILPVGGKSAAGCRKVLVGLKVVTAFILPATTPNMRCKLLIGLCMNVAYKSFVAVPALRAGVAGLHAAIGLQLVKVLHIYVVVLSVHSDRRHLGTDGQAYRCCCCLLWLRNILSTFWCDIPPMVWAISLKL